MKARLLGAALAAALGGALAGVLYLFSDLDRALVLDAYLVYVGAVLLQALARATGAATRPGGASAFAEALRSPRRRPDPPDRLLRLQGLLALATATAGDFHHGLRPPLRAAAAHALSARHGIDLDAQPERARDVLGAEAWELLRGDRPPPENRFARGPSLEELTRAVAAIERIQP